MNVWCWASSFLFLTFLFMTSTLHGLLSDQAAHAQTHTRAYCWKPKNSGAKSQRTTMQKHSINVIRGGKKESHIMLECLQNALLFTSSILFFSLFSCTLSIILALESGKKRVVVVVVVGDISCEWCPSLVTLKLFNPNTTTIKLTANPNHQSSIQSLYIGVIQCCCHSLYLSDLSFSCCHVLYFDIHFSWSPFTLMSHPSEKNHHISKWKCFKFFDAGVQMSAGNDKIKASNVFFLQLCGLIAQLFWCGFSPSCTVICVSFYSATECNFQGSNSSDYS